MTDQEWIKAVRDYAAQFGCYSFSQAERERMLPYLHSPWIKHLHSYRYVTHMQCNLVMTWELLDDMERGICEAVALRLTGASQ